MLGLAHFHAAVLATPVVHGLVRDAQFATDVRHFAAGVDFLDGADDLLLGEATQEVLAA